MMSQRPRLMRVSIAYSFSIDNATVGNSSLCTAARPMSDQETTQLDRLVCVCVCVRVYVYVCVYIYVHVCVCVCFK